MKFTNTPLYVLMGLLLGTAGAYAAECTTYQTQQGCQNLTVNYSNDDEGGEWMTAVFTPCQPASPGDTVSKEVPSAGETYCVQQDTTIDIGPHSTACHWTPNQLINYGLTVTCEGACGGTTSGCTVVDTPPPPPIKPLGPSNKPKPPKKPIEPVTPKK